MPQSLFVLNALIGNGVAVGPALTATFGAIGGAAIRLLGSVAINALVANLARPSAAQQDLRQRISVMKELVDKRFVYGHCFATGTPLPPHAENGYLYICYVLNSRISSGNFELYLDNRVVTLTGDPYDLTGAGATATNGLFANHLNVWFTRGDQTAPPATFTTDVPYHETNRPLGYKATDAGQGVTLAWLKIKRGDQGKVSNRWTSYPREPQLSVLGDWSLVWDPRETAQSLGDLTTHTFSKNQALCLLDLQTQNPFSAFAEDDLILDMWETSADVADIVVSRKDGGSEAQFEVAGTVVFGGAELEQLSEPLERAGASSIVRSGGRLGLVPGCAKTPALVIDDMEGLPRMSKVRPPEARYDVVHCTYSPLERAGEPASLKPWPIPGQATTGKLRVLSVDFSMVSSSGQAMRLRKIAGLKSTYSRRMDGTPFADALDLATGSWVTTNLRYSQMNGTFEVGGMHPLAHPVGGQGGVALRCPMELTEVSDAIFAWDAQEEEDVSHPAYVYSEDGVQPGGAISVTTGDTVNLNTGGTVIPRAKFHFSPSSSADVDSYQWQFAEGSEDYGATFSIDGALRDGSGDVFGYMTGAAGTAHKIRVRAVTLTGFSDWVVITGVTPVVNITIDTPSIGTISEPVAGTVRVPVTASNDPDANGVEVWAGPDGDPANASQVGVTTYISQNSMIEIDQSGVASGVTQHFFTRSVGDFGNVSAFSTDSTFTTA